MHIPCTAIIRRKGISYMTQALFPLQARPPVLANRVVTAALKRMCAALPCNVSHALNVEHCAVNAPRRAG
jgi:hypothetical protein